ncbi:MAG: hypothetical protein U0441_23685 [Polyangiaceae bacterium]
MFIQQAKHPPASSRGLDGVSKMEWYDPVSSFASNKGYRFKGDIAFCKVDAAFGQTRVELVVSNVGGGGHLNTVGAVIAQQGVLHCRAKAKVVGEANVEVRRRTLFDRIFSRGVRIGTPEFDAKYVAFGREEDVRRFLGDAVVKSFVAMWDKTQGLEVEDGEVSLSGGQFSLSPEDLAFIIETVGTIATARADSIAEK